MTKRKESITMAVDPGITDEELERLRRKPEPVNTASIIQNNSSNNIIKYSSFIANVAAFISTVVFLANWLTGCADTSSLLLSSVVLAGVAVIVTAIVAVFLANCFDSNAEHNKDGTLARTYPNGTANVGTATTNAEGSHSFMWVSFTLAVLLTGFSLFALAATLHQRGIERAQIDSILGKLGDSVQVVVDNRVYQVNTVDSIWLVSPLHNSSRKPLVGTYTVGSEITQNPLADIQRATESFCKQETRGYTEYKSCTELVTTETTVTKEQGELIKNEQHFHNVAIANLHSAEYATRIDNHQDILLGIPLGSNHWDWDHEWSITWSADSTTVTEQMRMNCLQLQYNDTYKRWELVNNNP